MTYKPSSELHRAAEQAENNEARLLAYQQKTADLRAKVPFFYVSDNWFIGKKQAG